MLKAIYLENVRIEATNQNDIISMIDPVDLAAIKQNDPHPYFQLYSVAHEGVSSPIVKVKDGPEYIEWPRKAIESIKNIVLKGLSLFKRHRQKSDTGDRLVIGKIIANREQEIDGKLHHLAVSYHKPDQVEEAKKCDSCSQEAEWNFFTQAKKWVADKIERFTGIAGLNSSEDRPAFAQAVRLAAIEAHTYQKKAPGEGSQPGEGTGEEVVKELKDFTFNEIIDHVKNERNARARDLVTLEDLKDDNTFRPIFEEIETIKAENESLKTAKEELDKKLDEIGKNERIATAKNRIDAIIKDKKIETDAIKNALLKIAESSPDATDEIIIARAEELKAIQDEILQKTEDQTTIPGGGAGPSGAIDLLDPANNEFLM